MLDLGLFEVIWKCTTERKSGFHVFVWRNPFSICSELLHHNYVIINCHAEKNPNNNVQIIDKASVCFQINIDCKTRATISKNISEPELVTFEMAQAQIYRLMTRDSYPRFLKSDFYQALLQKWGHTLLSLGLKCLSLRVCVWFPGKCRYMFVQA